MQELGTIEQVDLRRLWPNEAVDFTPWLANEISRLGDALGLELEVRDREAPVGGYSLDILAHDVGSNRPVIIENQLESTDHDHLGKLLTYASYYDANVVVWIARQFREEHRQALDWLNQRTDEHTQFVGVIVELLKIDDSRPAINFKLASSPNEWRKEAFATSRGRDAGTSERMERYRSYFQVLIDRLREDKGFTRARKGQPQSWYNFSSGHSGAAYSAEFNRDGKVSVSLYIDQGDRDLNKEVFDQLLQDKAAIESDLKESLEWQRLEDRRASKITVVRPGAIDDDNETLEDLQEWMIDRLLAFRSVLGPRLASLMSGRQ